MVVGAHSAHRTIFHWRAEDWTIIEALYFSVVTLTTIGYGDFTPTNAGTQIFTIIYILTGLGVFLALLASVRGAVRQAEVRRRRATTSALIAATGQLRRRTAVEAGQAARPG